MNVDVTRNALWFAYVQDYAIEIGSTGEPVSFRLQLRNQRLGKRMQINALKNLI